MADEEAWYDPFKRLFAGIGAGIPQTSGFGKAGKARLAWQRPDVARHGRARLS
jgi:hypothetical protein